MSATKVNILLRDVRVVDVLLGYNGSVAAGETVIRSQKLALPYHILKFTWFPQYSANPTNAWGEIYISDSPKEDKDSVGSKPNIVGEVSETTRFYGHSFYHHIWVELNRKVNKENYIYLRTPTLGTQKQLWVIVKVMLIPEPEREE